ncbi:hypothetical protein EYF80_051769 [Liparis tanakae]|uniref:Uncharacterized protein n=1 Tax=Liparis tanakae TaxID=230148 RepID=A0A4Z2FAY8_9TELE|nr:hypothetical protein EYF80_051769 [Liparis tanakae]
MPEKWKKTATLSTPPPTHRTSAAPSVIPIHHCQFSSCARLKPSSTCTALLCSFTLGSLPSSLRSPVSDSAVGSEDEDTKAPKTALKSQSAWQSVEGGKGAGLVSLMIIVNSIDNQFSGRITWPASSHYDAGVRETLSMMEVDIDSASSFALSCAFPPDARAEPRLCKASATVNGASLLG